MSKTSDLKTPLEILERNSFIEWTASDLGYLLRLGVVEGLKLRRGCLLNENHVIKLYKLKIKK